MKAREYLVERKLAIAGKQGKFSFKAIDALKEAMAEGVVFEDWNENGRILNAKPKSRIVKVKTERLAPVPTQSKVNDFNAMEITDSYGIKMVIQYCALGHPLKRCSCSEIKAPSHFNAIETKLIMR